MDFFCVLVAVNRMLSIIIFSRIKLLRRKSDDGILLVWMFYMRYLTREPYKHLFQIFVSQSQRDYPNISERVSF